MVLLGAGTDTVGNATTIGTFHVIKNKRIYARLVQELREAWPNPDDRMGYESIEKLPYLVGSPSINIEPSPHYRCRRAL
jgi:cytochrome P450